MNDKQKQSNYSLLLRYLGLGFQLLISLALALYAGKWLDEKWNLKTPLLIWILPLLILAATFYKVVKDTSKKK
ncbi:AtpZ/AtpI family protein [Danxiaibacter flavus]|uniref:AtpZ/AtpI family protein n=1 Tax=Danxiaibacter flavus TaxID=3049108 RepID=A0ABV3ZB45_9BACT|nr:AtpZ/AtpI family protein [Chitinophagaceae bacterium DXS]